MFEIFFQMSLKQVDRQLNGAEKKLSGFFSRLEELMDYYSISSINELAVKYLGYKSPQKLNRLKDEKANPSAEIIADIVSTWPEINANWLLIGSGKMLGSSNMVERTMAKATLEDVLLVMAEGYKAQVETVKNIEKNMARHDGQARIEASLQEVLAGVETIADRQGPAIQRILADLDELRRQKNGPS